MGMVARLGTVLYWIGCITAGLTASVAALLYMSEGYTRKDGPKVTGFILGHRLYYLARRVRTAVCPVRPQGVDRCDWRSGQVLGRDLRHAHPYGPARVRPIGRDDARETAHTVCRAQPLLREGAANARGHLLRCLLIGR